MKENKYICIMCPIGCLVTVKSDDKGDIAEVLGNRCKKGDKYARDELKSPMRVLTSTVAVEGADIARLPVRTSDIIPKDRIFDCMEEIQKAKAKAPVNMGDKIIENILGLGVDIIATRDVA